MSWCIQNSDFGENAVIHIKDAEMRCVGLGCLRRLDCVFVYLYLCFKTALYMQQLLCPQCREPEYSGYLAPTTMVAMQSNHHGQADALLILRGRTAVLKT